MQLRSGRRPVLQRCVRGEKVTHTGVPLEGSDRHTVPYFPEPKGLQVGVGAAVPG